MSRSKLYLALILLIVTVAPALPSTLDWYTDRALWELAVGGTFSNITFATQTGDYRNAAGVTYDDVNFIGPNGSAGYVLWVTGDQDLLGPTGTSSWPMVSYIRSRFTGSGYKAVGVDVKTSPAGKDLFVRTDTSTGFIGPYSTPGFVGFVSSDPVTYVYFAYYKNDSWNVQPVLDNFSYSNGPADPPADTPDVETLILCGTGLSVLTLARRLRKRIRA